MNILNLLVTNWAVWNAAEPLAIQKWKKSGSNKGLSFESEYPLCSWIDLISNTIGLLCVYCSKGYTSVMESSSLGFPECNRNSGLGFKLQIWVPVLQLNWFDYNTIGSLCAYCSRDYTSVIGVFFFALPECNRNSGSGFKLQIWVPIMQLNWFDLQY